MYMLLGLLVIIFSVFNIISAIKMKKKWLVILNGAFYSIIAFVLIWNNVNNAIITNDTEKYNIYHGGILGSVKYDRTEDDYYIIKRTGIMIADEADEIAIPANSTDISSFSKLYKPVMIYCNKGTELLGTDITINSEKYYLCDAVEKIVPDYSGLIFTIGLIDIMAVIIFNIVTFIINTVNSYQEKKDK